MIRRVLVVVLAAVAVGALPATASAEDTQVCVHTGQSSAICVQQGVVHIELPPVSNVIRVGSGGGGGA